MNENSQIFENLIHFTDLLMYFSDALFSFFYHCFIKDDFILQEDEVLPTKPEIRITHQVERLNRGDWKQTTPLPQAVGLG